MLLLNEISRATSAVLDIQSALISTGNQNGHNSDTGGLGWTASGKYYNSGGRTIHLFHPKSPEDRKRVVK